MEASCSVRRRKDVVEILVLRVVLDEELFGRVGHSEQLGHGARMLYIFTG